MSAETPTMPTGEDLLAQWQRFPHTNSRDCPECGASIRAIGIPELVYTFETCTCSEFEYDHLVETIWHRACFARRSIGAVIRFRRWSGNKRSGWEYRDLDPEDPSWAPCLVIQEPTS